MSHISLFFFLVTHSRLFVFFPHLFIHLFICLLTLFFRHSITASFSALTFFFLSTFSFSHTSHPRYTYSHYIYTVFISQPSSDTRTDFRVVIRVILAALTARVRPFNFLFLFSFLLLFFFSGYCSRKILPHSQRQITYRLAEGELLSLSFFFVLFLRRVYFTFMYFVINEFYSVNKTRPNPWLISATSYK